MCWLKGKCFNWRKKRNKKPCCFILVLFWPTTKTNSKFGCGPTNTENYFKVQEWKHAAKLGRKEWAKSHKKTFLGKCYCKTNRTNGYPFFYISFAVKSYLKYFLHVAIILNINCVIGKIRHSIYTIGDYYWWAVTHKLQTLRFDIHTSTTFWNKKILTSYIFNNSTLTLKFIHDYITFYKAVSTQ